MVTISYAITCHDELNELQRLIQQLELFVRSEDEIVIQQDLPEKETVEYNSTKNYVKQLTDLYPNIKIKTLQHKLSGDFSQFKNNIKNHCTKDYTFFIDADETVSENMLTYLPLVLENNPVDLFVIPRANTVNGITDNHIRQWGWRLENGLINWPDFQGRLVKNTDKIFWQGKVHEKIVGFETVSQFPIDNLDWCLHHNKDILKQEKQNKLYNSI
jgi:hypothetical protein